MVHPQLSKAYIELLKRGAFPGRIDPWAEQGRYFQQIHSGMIGDLLRQINDPLLEMGYVAGRETSLLIAERAEPDIFIQRLDMPSPFSTTRLDYAPAAVSVLAEPGLMVEMELSDNQESIFIREFDTNRLVTVIEIISPRNKTVPSEILQYQNRRLRLLSEEVNVVEIDLTRSYTRLLSDKLVNTYPYHIAVYPVGDRARLIGIEFAEALKRIAIPLRTEVIPAELHSAYQDAYQTASISAQILSENRYTEAYLPFPTMLNNQRPALLKALADWQQALQTLRDETS